MRGLCILHSRGCPSSPAGPWIFPISPLYLSLTNFKGCVFLFCPFFPPQSYVSWRLPSRWASFSVAFLGSMLWFTCSPFCCFIFSGLRWTSSPWRWFRSALSPVSSSGLLSSPGFLQPAFICRRALWRSRGGWGNETAGWAGMALSCLQCLSRPLWCGVALLFFLLDCFSRTFWEVRGPRQPPLSSAAQVYRSVLPILEFISGFLSAKKHIFHTSTSMQREHILHWCRLYLGWRGWRGSQSPGCTLSQRPVQILKSLLEGFWGAHTGGVNSEPCVGFVVQILRRTLLLPFTGWVSTRFFLLFLPAGQAFYLLLFYPIYLGLHRAHGVQPLWWGPY